MKITPLDIHHKKFRTGFKGYNVDEVDQFLDELSAQLDTLYKQNSSMKVKLDETEALVNKYKNLEGALNSALVNAQKLAEDVVSRANSEAHNIVNDAKKEAKDIFDTSVEQRAELMQSIKRLESIDRSAKTKLLNVLEEFTNVINGAEAIVEEKTIKAEEDLSERLHEFIKETVSTETSDENTSAVITEDSQPEAIEEQVEVAIESKEATTATESVTNDTEEKIETPQVQETKDRESVEILNNHPSETVELVNAGAQPEINETEEIIAIDIEKVVSNEEKSLLLNANGHGKSEQNLDNPFADLGDGVPGAIRRKKKINE